MQRRMVSLGTRSRQGKANPLDAVRRLSEAERCRRTGDFARVQSLCESLLQEYPDYVGALQTLGVAQLAQKNYRQALSCFVQAAMHCPKDGVNLTNLATAYLRLGAKELAAQTLEQARRLNPDDVDVYLILAEVHRENREYDLAADCYRTVLTLMPSNADAAHGLGDCYSQLGRIADAAAALKKAHELKPNSVAILYALSQLPASALDIEILEALDRTRKEEESQDQSDFDAMVAFTRGTALHRQCRHQEAWATLVEVNHREFPKHEREYQRQLVRMKAARKAALQPLDAARTPPGVSSTLPLSLFVLGPSRSGKTTLERLVGQLKGVKCGYESRLAERAARRTSQLSGLLTLRNPADLPRTLDARFRQIYLEEVREFARGAGIVSDTYPAMIPYVGRVATTIPNARFIFIKRDTYDCALRIFMKHYRAGNDYAYDIKTIFAYISWYYAMIDIWCEKFPEVTLRVEYDEMVARPEATLVRVAEFCGASMAVSAAPNLGDDRGCAQGYRELIDTALKEQAEA